MEMSALEVAQKYFDAWNRRDAAAVLATFAEGGTYSDPSSGGRLSGDALAGYMNGLWAAFPDLSFEVASAGEAGPDLVAAQWLMRGTNSGSMMGLPPTGKSVTLAGADFIRVSNGKILTVDGYFDTRALPEQLGLDVVVQPKQIGPFTFGTAVRVWGGKNAEPGAYSVTALQARSAADGAAVGEESRPIAEELLSMNGFLGFVGVTVGERKLTITAWENPGDPQQLLKGGRHAAAMKRFFGDELGGGGVTSVWVPDRIGVRWSRCAACGKMQDHERNGGACPCGARLPDPLPYW
jgi:steroid delta-isomerase-like uncharacterized protein